MSCRTCNCNPCCCSSNTVEPLASEVENFITAIYGTVTKQVVNGEWVWTLPCNLSASEPVTGFPRLEGEGTECYMLRLFVYLNSVVSGFVLPVGISSGGTGGTTAAEARTNLGLEIGVDVQEQCGNLDLWCVKDPPSGAVVGTTDSQTLSNKTITNAANTKQTLTDAATIAWDASLGSVAEVALGANRAMGLPTNLKVGTYILITTGAFGITSWDAIFQWAGGSAPTAAGTKNVYSFVYEGSNLVGAAVLDAS